MLLLGVSLPVLYAAAPGAHVLTMTQRMTDHLAPGETNVPYLTVGATDARFFRRSGATAYGFGFFPGQFGMAVFSQHHHNGPTADLIVNDALFLQPVPNH